MPGRPSKMVCSFSFKTNGYLIHVLDDVQAIKKGSSKTIKTPIVIQTKSNGCPEIPSITKADGYKAKVVQVMLRDYFNTHIRESSYDHA